MKMSIEEARAPVQREYEMLVAWVEQCDVWKFCPFERELWTRLLALGRALVVLFLTRQALRTRAWEYTHEGVLYQLSGERVSNFKCKFGEVKFWRPVGRRPEAPRAAADRVVDRELGLQSGFSPAAVVGMAKLCAQMAYANARQTWTDAYQWCPSPRAVLRMVDGVGGDALPFIEEASAPDGDGEILVIQVDGKGAPMINDAEYRRRCQPHQGPIPLPGRRQRRMHRRANPKPRRTKGKKSKNAKVAVVGVIYTLKMTDRGLEGPVNKRLIATFNGHEELMIRLRHEAGKRGYGQKRSLFIADGCEHIWRLQLRYFPDAEGCLDFFHIIEKVWEVGHCFHKEGSKQLAEWVGRQARRLLDDKVPELLEELETRLAATPAKGPGNKWRRKVLTRTIRHLDKNRGRLEYKAFRKQDFDIGSGAVEGAVRNLVGMRLDGPGMRWSRQRSEKILHLRCILLNRQWEDFEAYLEARGAPTLASKPQPTRTHNAKAAA